MEAYLTKILYCAMLNLYHLTLPDCTTCSSSIPYGCLSPARAPTRGDDESGNVRALDPSQHPARPKHTTHEANINYIRARAFEPTALHRQQHIIASSYLRILLAYSKECTEELHNHHCPRPCIRMSDCLGQNCLKVTWLNLPKNQSAKPAYELELHVDSKLRTTRLQTPP